VEAGLMKSHSVFELEAGFVLKRYSSVSELEAE